MIWILVVVLSIGFAAASITASIGRETIEDLREQLSTMQLLYLEVAGAAEFVRQQRDARDRELAAVRAKPVETEESLATAYRRIAVLENGGGLG